MWRILIVPSIGTKISSGCNFEIALRLSTHFLPFHNGMRNERLGVFLVIHSSLPHLASGTSTAVAKQQGRGGSPGACVMPLSGARGSVLERVRGTEEEH